MDILATGAERVRALETALGGQPPEDRNSATEIDRYVRRRFDQRTARHAEAQSRLEQRDALLQDTREAHPDLYTFFEKLDQTSATKSPHRPPRKSVERPPRLPHLNGTEPKIAAGSGFTLKVPPYDDQGQGINGDASASPDALQGNYNLQTNSNCGTSTAWAGIAVNFYAISDNQFQRFAALMDYDYDWGDQTDIFSEAHNGGNTCIWVWGYTEQRWVLQQSKAGPWWDSDVRDAGSGDDEGGRLTIETQFPAFGGNWYKAWVFSALESDGNCGFLSSSYSWNSYNVQIPFVVFGSL
jgi:hypothetical protein